MSRTLRDAILAACADLEAAREALCLLDATSGDGDHGVTMAIAARGVRAKLAQLPADEPEGVVRAAALGMAGAGGTIGAVYARGLLAVAARLHEAESEMPTVALLASAVYRAAIATGGLGAQPGDKTILDALQPLAAALADAAAANLSMPETLARADAAARQGADATADMVARVGRSARFAERSRGTIDPGAASLAIIVHALVTSALRPAGPD